MNFSISHRIPRFKTQIKHIRALYTPSTTQSSTSLWRALEDGSGESIPTGTLVVRQLTKPPEEPVNEADLFRYQRYRWLSGEPEKLAMRHRKFDVQGLIDVSVKAVGISGINCIKLVKCVEGQFNKAFLLTMSNGFEIIARLPNPNAGSAFYITASEVATRHFIRDNMGLPTPRIYDWSSVACNPVGAEYILEEKAPGQPLGAIWGELSSVTHSKIVEQIVDIEKKLALISFPKHGYIYYEADLKSRSVEYERVHPDSFQDENAPAFVIGPSADPSLWRPERAQMNLDRGPWRSVADYSRSLGMNEIQWAASHARPRMNFHRSMDSPETPSQYIALLEKYITLSPYLASSLELPNRISHPDLHLDNIFVDPDTFRITSIIDWQHAHISPISLQRRHPQMFELSASPQSKQGKHERNLLNLYYDAIERTDPIRWKALSDPLFQAMTSPIAMVPGCWDREDLFSLRNALIAIIAHWNDMGHGETPCPVNFEEQELLQHQDEMDMLEGISKILQQLQDEGLISLGGMVRPEFYQRAMDLNDLLKSEFVNLAENEQQRELHAKMWPYQ